MIQATIKRAARRPTLWPGVLCLLPLTAVLLAQSNRESYRNLYHAWRDADAKLELDAATAAPDSLATRAGKAAGLASAYTAARVAVVKDAAAQQTPNLQWLTANTVQPLPLLAPSPDELRLVNRELAGVSASGATFANDPDPAIRQLRQAFQREQTALDAVKTSITDRQQVETKAMQSVSAAEIARVKALQEFSLLSSALDQSANEMSQEAAAWGTYYAKLQQVATEPSAPSAAPSSGAAVSSVASPGGSPSAGAVAAAPRSPTITPVPLLRYTGVWSYRQGLPSFGSQPEVVDFVLHEDNGHAMGTFYARFKLPPGSTGDPVLRFDFAGDFKSTLQQSFKLTTTDGAVGTVQLTPGVAFNELEVTFNTDSKAGKVRQGDMILLKQ